MDLNHRPHPYQGCALTALSYGPERAILVAARPSRSEEHGGGPYATAPAAPTFYFLKLAIWVCGFVGPVK